ncbi:SPARC-like [Oppia nitens]|uniref:SPARC-like n=1 Tax=Oppia nitens TaxID=1686743 RepID=UPI0023DCB99C|nr:SPARC-like [Oppia nitens]
MNKYLLIVVVLLAIIVASIDAKKERKQRKSQLNTDEIAVKSATDTAAANEVVKQDQCLKLKCDAGKECVIDTESGKAKCQCISTCADNTDVRRRVCSNHNTTWQSDCHLYKHRCDCIEGQKSSDCDDKHKHMHIDYYGECQELPECRKEVLEDFPRRMREWLDHIISKKVETSGTGDDGSDHSKKWIDAIIWKFCDLDKQPHDRQVSRHELFPLRAPLLSMESCISDFLNGCDPNDDHKITLVEWGECLGATDAEMVDKCNKFHSIKEN